MAEVLDMGRGKGRVEGEEGNAMAEWPGW